MLEPDSSGGYIESILHNFGDGTDGFLPSPNLTLDVFGNLYGTTFGGGSTGYGTVFRLTPSGNCNDTETVLYTFESGIDGASPMSLVRDASGNLYGTTLVGGSAANGTVFKLTPSGNST